MNAERGKRETKDKDKDSGLCFVGEIVPFTEIVNTEEGGSLKRKTVN